MEKTNTFKDTNIAVFLHLYHHELWPEIYNYLQNLNHLQFSLYVSLTTDNQGIETLKNQLQSIYPTAIIRGYPNKGLDVGPFLLLLKEAYNQEKKHDFILKIHTKKSSLHNPNVGERVRKICFQILLGNARKINRIIKLLNTDKIGMVGPAEFIHICDQNDKNLQSVQDIKKELGIDEGKTSFYNTMFWAKFWVFKKYFTIEKIDLLYKSMAPGWKYDETPAHALERVFGHMIENEGMKLYSPDKYKVMAKNIIFKIRKKLSYFIF